MKVKKPVNKDKLNGATGDTARNAVWDLSELYSSPDDKKLAADLKLGVKLAADFNKKYCGKAGSDKFSVDSMHKALVEYENVMEIANKTIQYAHLLFSLDTSSQKAKALLGKAEEVCADIDNDTLFFRLEICHVCDHKMDDYYKAPKLAKYKHFLKTVRAFKNYQLSEAEEKVINLKNLSGRNSVVKLFDELTSSFRFEMKMEDGKLHKMNASQLRNLRYHPSADIRKRSSELFFGKYSENLLTISSLYNMITRDAATENKMRGYKRPDESMNVSNELPNKVVDTLIDVTTKNTKIVQRYYTLKAKLLKVKKLNLCDIYAPTAKSAKKFTWDEAREIVLENFKNFDDKFYELAKKFFDNGWIDARLLDSKRGGAYCSSSYPGLHPYVFMNFTGSMRDVMTLAHELGHAIHSMLSSKNTILNFHAILPLAETASIFSERIVSDNIFKRLTDKNEKISLLTGMLEDFFATSVRQNMFTRFEHAAHLASAENILSSDELTAIYKDELKIMFGSAVNITEDFHVEWSHIPHIFHTPFYCYSYNFALLLVLALYQKYCEEGPKFKKGFMELLSSGSSKSPQELLSAMKINIADPKFWQKGFDYISARVNELEKIIKEK